jgi:hypothetical protein
LKAVAVAAAAAAPVAVVVVDFAAAAEVAAVVASMIAAAVVARVVVVPGVAEVAAVVASMIAAAPKRPPPPVHPRLFRKCVSHFDPGPVFISRFYIFSKIKRTKHLKQKQNTKALKKLWKKRLWITQNNSENTHNKHGKHTKQKYGKLER